MCVLFAIGAAVTLCAFVWKCAVYALPLFAAFSAGFWSLAHGAGPGSLAVGAMAGVLVYAAVAFGARSTHAWVRWLTVILFVSPAALTGCCIPYELLTSITPLWRDAISLLAALCVAGTAYQRSTEMGGG